MKYSDIIQLRSMRPAYNIKEESLDEWKTFIANDQFNGVLDKMIKAVRANDADTHKSIWISGTYGSGKSHAGAVLQHLFCDPIEDIQEYVEEEYKKEKYDLLRTSLLQVRQQKRLFPVHFYGLQKMAHVEDLSLQIQREVKVALADANLEIVVDTDFDILVRHIDEHPQLWQTLLDSDAELKASAPDLKFLKNKLKGGDMGLLNIVVNAQRAARIDIRMENTDIQKWIFKVQNKLRETTAFDGLLLIWDEFTEVMTSSFGLSVLNILQEINEAMMNMENGSYFLFISHPSALNGLEAAKRETTKGRYHYLSYNMEAVSAFKIMSKKFKIIDDANYEKIQSRFFDMHPGILDPISVESTNQEETQENIRNLFPLHPGTANLATYFAREAGSSSRSVFEFLACDAIRAFMDDTTMYLKHATITADYLWDYVQGYFESDSARFGAVTERYNSHHLAVEAAGEDFLRVFKGILLLNALNNIANNDTVTPSRENISNLFVGTDFEMRLDEILDFFNDKSIIQRQPNGNFSILFTALPGEEILIIKEELKKSTYLYTDQVIKSGTVAKDLFETYMQQVARPKEFQFFSMQVNPFTLLNKIDTARKTTKGYKLFIAVLVGKNTDEVLQLRKMAEENSKEERFATTIFLVADATLGEKNYERFIEYQANAQCAQRHGLANQQKTYNKNASDMVSDWVCRIKAGNITFYVKGQELTINGGKIASTINSTIAVLIFEQGPESLDVIRLAKSTTFWKQASVKATVDAVLCYNTKQEIMDACKGPQMHVNYLLQDSVDDNLNWKSDVNPKHPLKLVCDYIDEWLSGKHTNKNQVFNLGDKLIGLTEAPYGLFQSYAPMAMVAFALRKYINQIYDTNGKQRQAKHLVEDVVELFRAWEADKTSAKLNFMFESKEAGKICKHLIDCFGLKKLKGYSDISSLKDARWAIQHEYAKEKNYPLWALKYAESEFNTEAINKFIDNIIKIVEDPESMKNANLLSETTKQFDELQMDLGNLLLPSVNFFETGFKNRLKQDAVVAMNDEDFPSVLTYLQQHLQGEVGLWSELDVMQALKDWKIQMTSKVIYNGGDGNDNDGPSSHSGGGSSNSNYQEEVKQKRAFLVNKVNNSGLEKLRQVLVNLANEGDLSLLDQLLRYV